MKTLLALSIALLVSNPTFSQGTLVYDQQATTGNLASGGAPIQDQQPMGQSFTPSLSTVGFMQFQFGDFRGTQGATVYVNLLTDSITGTVIGTTAPVFMPNGFRGITNFFFPANIPVQPEIEYFFLPVLQSGDNTDLMADIFSYTRGTAIVAGQPSSAGLDFWFREGIVVPEPSSGFLLVLGSSMAGWSMRQRIRGLH